MKTQKGLPRVVIAGTHSGSGKTTITTGLMAALTLKGFVVQGFKAGPDFIDPQCHYQASGRPGRILDTWLMEPDQVRAVFNHGASGATVAIIEGVMGMYDGAGGTAKSGSTAHLAKVLSAPVILVVDAGSTARSIAATVLGFKMFDPDVRLAGVIANRVGSTAHAAMVRVALAEIGVPLLGIIERNQSLWLADGRQGLDVTGQDGNLARWAAAAGELVGAGINLEQVITAAAGAGALDQTELFDANLAGRGRGLRIGVATDSAFWFYRQDTLDFLDHLGVETVRFSPLSDFGLPRPVHGLYIGGGMIEEHAAALAANTAMRASMQAAARAQLPILAEGGGYEYLLASLTTADGLTHEMTGCLPGRAARSRRPALGYRIAAPGAVRGSVFHRMEVTGPAGPPAWQLYHHDGVFDRPDGFRGGRILAGHLYVNHAIQSDSLFTFMSHCRGFSASPADR